LSDFIVASNHKYEVANETLGKSVALESRRPLGGAPHPTLNPSPLVGREKSMNITTGGLMIRCSSLQFNDQPPATAGGSDKTLWH
jgi:hypothetical protein